MLLSSWPKEGGKAGWALAEKVVGEEGLKNFCYAGRVPCEYTVDCGLYSMFRGVR